MSAKRLSPMQLSFVHEYLVDYNGKAAAIRAGYSESCAKQKASQLLKHPLIRAEIEAHNSEVQKSALISRDRVTQMMMELYEASAVRIPKLDFAGDQIIDSEGKPVYKMLDPQSAAKAIDMLAKHTGAYEADNQQKPDTEIVIKWGGGDGN